MGTTISELESRRAHEVADQYRSRGYKVIIGPKPHQLPPFLAGFRPDLLM